MPGAKTSCRYCEIHNNFKTASHVVWTVQRFADSESRSVWTKLISHQQWILMSLSTLYLFRIHSAVLSTAQSSASLLHLDKQSEAVKKLQGCCYILSVFSVKAPKGSQIRCWGELGFEFLKSQYCRNSQGRCYCCWVENWEGGAEMRKIFRWV